jgi:magnesium-transporting ATPase (P-type)
VLSVTMAVGARLLARKKAIVSKLVAIEELAGVDVLCADKTGTLTQNKLTLGKPFTMQGVTTEQVILNGALSSRSDNDDTIDQAHVGHHIRAVEIDTAATRRAQCHVQHGTLFSDIDLVAGKHGVSALRDATHFGQFQQQLQSFVGDAVFGIV